MLKIDFFPPDIVKEYEDEIAAEVKSQNGGKDEIYFISDMPQYKISIHDLLTAERKKILAIDGIPLYMYICSSQKFKICNQNALNALNAFLQILESEFHNDVEKKGQHEYEINGKTYDIEDENCIQDIIAEAAELLKRKFSSYNEQYAEKYFNRDFNSFSDLNNVLEEMFGDLNKNLKSHLKNRTPESDLIIDYSMLKGKLRHKILNSLGVRTCPYCNRNYITPYGPKGNKSTADLDHFYQKKKYPLFALSLFNFVPSCSVCNSRLKNVHPADDALYPYEEGFEDDAHFELVPKGENISGRTTLSLFQAIKDTKYDDFDVKIVINSQTPDDKRRKIENSKELFHLTEVYANHKQDALEAALRTRVYCEENYRIHCQKILNKLEQAGMKMSSSVDLEASVFADMIDYEWLMFGIFFNDEKRRYEKPLSKMIYDIYKSGKE